VIVTTEYYCSSNLAQQISSYILVKEIFRIGVTSGMITIFLHRMIAKNLYLENPMSATLASLSKINYSRWRPIWPPNSVSVIFQLPIVLEVWFFALSIGFWGQRFHWCYYECSKFKMATIFQDGFHSYL